MTTRQLARSLGLQEAALRYHLRQWAEKYDVVKPGRRKPWKAVLRHPAAVASFKAFMRAKLECQ